MFPNGVEILIFADGFIPAGPRVCRVRVPEGTTRRDPSRWHAALSPRRTAGARVGDSTTPASPAPGDPEGSL